MPATAGRVRMPANNRVHSSAALQTHGIWQSAIGYDPYAPTANEKKAAGQAGREPENAYDSFQGLLALARLTSSKGSEIRGACKKCGRVGHLIFQCRNFLSLKDDLVLLPEPEKERKAKDIDRTENNGGGDKSLQGEKEGNLSSEGDDESTDVTDSSEDSEMERIIAKRFGGKYGKWRSGVSVKNSSVSLEDDFGEGRERRRLGRRGKGEKVRVSSKKWDKSRVFSDEEVEDSEDNDSERRLVSRKRKFRASSRNCEKSRVSSDVECEDWDSEDKKSRKRKIGFPSRKCEKFRGSSYDESENSDYDTKRDERSRSWRRKSRVSKVSRVSSHSEDSEHEDRERRKRVKFWRSSKRVYSDCRKGRGYRDESSDCSSDVKRERKRVKHRRVEYSAYSDHERRKRNDSCSTGSNSDSE